METRAIAFFDFDGTVSSGDSIVPYVLYCSSRGIAPGGQIFRALGGWLKQKITRSDTLTAKRTALSFLKGRSKAETDGLAREFFQDIIMPNHVFPQAKAEMEKLKEQGMTVLVVSASTSAYMDVLPDFLPVDGVICTRCCTDRKGRYTGELENNCRGEAKTELIERYLKGRGWAADWENCRAYGDTAGDAPMLRLTGHPVMVNPKKKLVSLMPEAARVSWKK